MPYNPVLHVRDHLDVNEVMQMYASEGPIFMDDLLSKLPAEVARLRQEALDMHAASESKKLPLFTSSVLHVQLDASRTTNIMVLFGLFNA